MANEGRPYTTLFLLTSVDGKISSGATDELDVDADWRRIVGVREGIHQYYELEQSTDLFSLNSGRTWAKIGYNDSTDDPPQTPVTFVVVDNRPHLTLAGIRFAAKKAKKLIVVTANTNHPALHARTELKNLFVLQYTAEVDFADLMHRLKSEFGADRLTIQTGGTLNAELLRLGLVDRVLLVVAPLLVGGRETASLIGGASIIKIEDLAQLRPLKLVSCRALSHSYIQLEYQVLPETLVV